MQSMKNRMSGGECLGEVECILWKKGKVGNKKVRKNQGLEGNAFYMNQCSKPRNMGSLPPPPPPNSMLISGKAFHFPFSQLYFNSA